MQIFSIHKMKYNVSKLQFAEESNWENCCIFDDKSKIVCFHEWSANVTNGNIAVEAFFDIPEKGVHGAFAGMRFKSSLQILSMFNNIAEFFITDRAGFALSTFIILTESGSGLHLFRSTYTYAELGVINYWNSFGAVRLQSKTPAACEKETNNIFKSDPRWNNPPGETAIEFAYTKPIPHWIGCNTNELVNLCTVLNLRGQPEI